MNGVWQIGSSPKSAATALVFGDNCSKLLLTRASAPTNLDELAGHVPEFVPVFEVELEHRIDLVECGLPDERRYLGMIVDPFLFGLVRH